VAANCSRIDKDGYSGITIIERYCIQVTYEAASNCRVSSQVYGRLLEVGDRLEITASPAFLRAIT
jgi:hypothetical protein